MKKVLFTTTALVAVAGMASADVSMTGSGRFGLVYNSGNDAVAATGTADEIALAKTAAETAVTNVTNATAAGNLTAEQLFQVLYTATLLDTIDGTAAVDSTVKVEQRFTINIDGSGETDGGLSFGGRVRLRSDENGSGSNVASANVYLGNDTWRITVGNTSGAMVTRLGYFQGTVGLTGLQWANVSFNIGSNTFALNSYSSTGNAGDVVRLDFNVGGLGVSLSTDSTGDGLSGSSEDSIAASYTFGDWSVAAGFGADATTEGDVWAISAKGNIGDFGIGIQYHDSANIGNKVVLNGSYDFGDTSVTAFIAQTKVDEAGKFGFADGSNSEAEYGIGFTHSLGGAVLVGGISRNYASNTMADLGVRFQF